MDIKEIKQVIDIMKRAGLTEFEIEEEGLKLRICRNPGGNNAAPTIQTTAPYPAYIPPPIVHQPAPAPVEAPAAKEPKEEKGIVIIKSPMVGTFYRSPSPESPEFCKIGDTVNNESTVCIIEAMKVMNEISAELSGEIKQVLVENGESIEFGQPLFKVKQP